MELWRCGVLAVYNTVNMEYLRLLSIWSTESLEYWYFGVLLAELGRGISENSERIVVLMEDGRVSV